MLPTPVSLIGRPIRPSIEPWAFAGGPLDRCPPEKINHPICLKRPFKPARPDRPDVLPIEQETRIPTKKPASSKSGAGSFFVGGEAS